MPIPFKGTKKEFDQLPADRKYYCPECGLAITTPHGNCDCPTRFTRQGFAFVEHINRNHHNCDIAWKEAYGRTK